MAWWALLWACALLRGPSLRTTPRDDARRGDPDTSPRATAPRDPPRRPEARPLANLAPLWHRDEPLGLVAANARHVVATRIARDAAIVLALDIVTGAVAWRAKSWHGLTPREFVTDRWTALAAPDTVVTLRADNELVAFDGASGRSLWRYGGGPGSRFEPVARANGMLWLRQIWSGGPTEIVTLDPTSGREQSRTHDDPDKWQSFVDEPSAPATGGVLVRSSGDATESVDPSSGAVRWRHTPALSSPVVAGDAVYGCTSGQVLEALDVDTGTLRWSAGLGACDADAGQPGFRVVRDTAVGDVLLVGGPSGGIRAFARAASTVAPAEAYVIAGTLRVNGRGRAGIVVHIGEVAVRTDARGRFRASGVGRGLVVVTISEAEVASGGRYDCGEAVRHQVNLDGRQTYALELATTAYHDPEGLCGHSDI